MSRVNPSFKGLIATLCLAAQALVLGHYTLVEHTRCAEHGALVHADAHVDAHVGGHGAEHGVTAAADVASDQVTTGEVAHDDNHDHCATTSERRKAVSAPNSTAVTLAALVTTRSAPVLPVFSASRALHSIAPKTSPPA